MLDHEGLKRSDDFLVHGPNCLRGNVDACHATISDHGPFCKPSDGVFWRIRRVYHRIRSSAIIDKCDQTNLVN
jgi:hypothetical protein